jgi:TatD DNase family protein
MPLFNIHSHSTNPIPTNGVIVNAANGFEQLNPEVNYSAGLHPWFLKTETAQHEFAMLRTVCKSENVLAVGECGLDKVCETPFELQEEYFVKQILLANEVTKPLIIHCVRAYSEALAVLRKNSVSVSVVFHGFNRNSNIAASILDHGHFLSFGKHLLSSDDVRNVFRMIPIEKIVLETDDSDIHIKEIYRVAASLREIDISVFENQIATNVSRIFGKQF